MSTRIARILAASSLIVGCTGTIEPNEGAVPRSPTGVASKPIIVTPTGPAIADELVVGFTRDTQPAEIDIAVLDLGGEVVWHALYSDRYVVRFDDAAAASAAARALARHPDVEEVSYNHIHSGSGIGTSPIDLQWNLHGMGLDPADSWGLAAPVNVAVLDTGVAYEDYADELGAYAVAPDMATTLFAPGYDFVNDDDHANDDQGHGTHVAGVIAAAGGIAAVAPGAVIIPVKVLDAANQGTELALAEGIFYAVDQGADVINMSLSFSPAYFPTRYLQGAIDYASQHGVVMVAAVGNHGGEVVTYPAAFRDVVAVGASRLRYNYRVKDPEDPWAWAAWRLKPATYSNAGSLVDVSAPAGLIDRDVDGDGNPEAVLAQTFAGDPTEFDYYFYAGTSQAAAEVSGVAAMMLGARPELSPFQVRALVGETARPRGWRILDAEVGRGYLRADRAIYAAEGAGATQSRPRFFTTTYLVVDELGKDKRRASVDVEVVDEDGHPVPWVVVYGTFTGATYSSARGVTNHHGQVSLKSSKWSDPTGTLVAFQVDAVAGWGAFDRPRGFVRIDSCSLDRLASFATASGIGTSPIGLDYSLPGGGNDLSSLRLLNYSWDLATVPMTVAVDSEWLMSVDPNADLMRVVSFGSGIGTSPIDIGPLSFHESWLATMPFLAEESDECVDLLVRTFAGGELEAPFNPVIPDPNGDCQDDDSCEELVLLLGEMWDAWGTGIGTSPVWEPGLGITQPAFDHLAATMQDYVSFGASTDASPVGDYGAVLDAAGIGLTPASDEPAGGTGIEAMN